MAWFQSEDPQLRGKHTKDKRRTPFTSQQFLYCEWDSVHATPIHSESSIFTLKCTWSTWFHYSSQPRSGTGVQPISVMHTWHIYILSDFALINEPKLVFYFADAVFAFHFAVISLMRFACNSNYCHLIKRWRERQQRNLEYWSVPKSAIILKAKHISHINVRTIHGLQSPPSAFRLEPTHFWYLQRRTIPLKRMTRKMKNTKHQKKLSIAAAAFFACTFYPTLMSLSSYVTSQTACECNTN